jgi:hypothetical protein
MRALMKTNYLNFTHALAAPPRVRLRRQLIC